LPATLYNPARNLHLNEPVSVYNLQGDRASRGGIGAIAFFL
jgi:hypothetical protein